jgi:hypothetical protein
MNAHVCRLSDIAAIWVSMPHICLLLIAALAIMWNLHGH